VGRVVAEDQTLEGGLVGDEEAFAAVRAAVQGNHRVRTVLSMVA